MWNLKVLAVVIAVIPGLSCLGVEAADVRVCEYGILTQCKDNEICYIPEGSMKRSGICVLKGLSCSTVYCRSYNYAFKECNVSSKIDSVRSIKVSNKVSKSACTEGESYGLSDAGMWVDKGCRAHFEICYGALSAASCGGKLTNKTGEVTATGIAPNTSCDWYIVRSDNKSTQTSVQLTYSLDVNDSITVYQGNKTSKIVSYKTGTGNDLIISLKDVTTVQFKRGGNVKSTSHLLFTYDTKECKKTVKQEDNGFRSPVYKPGSGRLSCQYTVNKAASDGLLILGFEKFNIPNGYLSVNHTNVTVLTGTALPDDVILYNTQLELELVISNNKKMQMFQADFSSVNPECSGPINVKDNETATLAVRVPTKFPAECRGYIKSSSSKSTLVAMPNYIQFADAGDTLIFQDGGSSFSPVIARVGSSADSGKVILSSGQSMIVRLLLPDAAVGQPRNGTVTIYQPANGGRFYDQGRIELKNKPNKTVSSRPAYYLLTVSKDKQVELVMNKSAMYPSASLDVYDGCDVSHRKLVTFRSQDVPFFPVTSSGNELLVVASNFTSNQSSFTADFSAVKPGCNYVSTEAVGSLKLMRSNVGKSSCSWTVNPQLANGNILLKIKSLNLCENETVTLYQGLTSSGTVRLATVSHKDMLRDIPVFVSPAGTGIKVVLSHKVGDCSNKTISNNALSAYYSVQDKECGGTLTAPSGRITSPGYPNQYPANSNCMWKTAKLNKTVVYFTFKQLQLNTAHTLNFSLVSGAVPKQMVSYTGNILPQDFVTTVIKKTLFVKFDATTKTLGSNVPGVGQGFSLTYKKLDCGGYYTKASGVFGVPKAVSSNTECIWIVQLPKTGEKKSVNIVTFNLTTQNWKKTTKLEIRDGGSVRDPLLNYNITKGLAKAVLSRTNLLWVRYTFQGKKSGFTFNLKYNLYSCNKSQQCDNGLCLHPDWRCNGNDDCGDNTDERNCIKPIPTPQTSEEGVKAYIVVIIAILCFAVGVVLTIVVPAAYKRIRYPNYSQLKDLMEPSVA